LETIARVITIEDGRHFIEGIEDEEEEASIQHRPIPSLQKSDTCPAGLQLEMLEKKT
jgi:hypothetical protein